MPTTLLIQQNLQQYNELFAKEQKQKRVQTNYFLLKLGVVILVTFPIWTVVLGVVFFALSFAREAVMDGDLLGALGTLLFFCLIFGLQAWVLYRAATGTYRQVLQKAVLQKERSPAKILLQTSILPLYFQGFLANIKTKPLNEIVVFSRVTHDCVYLHSNRIVRYNPRLQGISVPKKFRESSFLALVEDALNFEYQNRSCVFTELKVKKRQFFWYRNYRNWLIVQIPVDHHFEGVTVVYSKQVSGVYREGLQADRFESPRFSELFEVYTNNPREARVCLKTNVLSALLDLQRQRARPLWLEFKDQTVFIGLDHPAGIFECQPSQPLTVHDLQSSGELLHWLLEITNQLKVNHEYLYKS